MKAGDFHTYKAGGKENIAELMTKPLDMQRMEELLEAMSVMTCNGAEIQYRRCQSLKGEGE